MKKHAYFIGIDNGGSAIKAAVFDENGRELSVSQIQIPMDHPNPGWTERDPLSVWRGNCQVIRFVPRTLKAFQSAGMAEVLDS